MAMTYENTQEDSSSQSKKWLAFARNNAAILLIYLFIFLLIGTGSFFSDRFLTASNLLNIMRQSIVLGLLAIGQTAVLLTGGMDISQEMVARLVGLVVATLFAATGSNPMMILPLLLLGTTIGVILGLVNGLLITRTHAVPFIITFGVSFLLRGINLAISTTPIRGVPDAYLSVYDAKIGIVPVNVIVLALVWWGAWLFTTRSRLGRNIYAVGGSERIAKLSAIRVNRTLVWAYVLSSAFAALAGLFLLARTGVGDPNAADGMTFQAIVAAAVGGISLYGGRGSIFGTLGGVLLLTLLSNFFNLMQINIFYQQLLLGIIVLVAVSAYKSKDLGAL
jgi:ribose/xylose/arabinose/galactoside ABC-type transport system permease subunit